MLNINVPNHVTKDLLGDIWNTDIVILDREIN